MGFNTREHANELSEIDSLIGYAQAAAEVQMGEKQYNYCALGVFGLIAHTLNEVRNHLEEIEAEFRSYNGLYHGKE